MKILSAAFILLLAGLSGVALAANGQPVDAAGFSLQAIYTDNPVLTANSEQKSAESDSIRCACVVPMTYA